MIRLLALIFFGIPVMIWLAIVAWGFLGQILSTPSGVIISIILALGFIIAVVRETRKQNREALGLTSSKKSPARRAA